MIPDGERYVERVPANVERYLELLERRGQRTTFFTVGDTARRYPELIREIADAGHELACHSSEHVPLDRQDANSLREDLLRNRDDLVRAGADEVVGFRAPIFSLTERSAWAHEVLAELGFLYSSSVIPTRNLLHGWDGFGAHCRRMQSGIWEIPVSVTGFLGRRIPFAGGFYFRLFPLAILRPLFRRQGPAPVVGYFHPYDIDVEQERFMHPELGGNRALNALMYLNRSRVLGRLENLIGQGLSVLPYAEFVAKYLEDDVSQDAAAES